MHSCGQFQSGSRDCKQTKNGDGEDLCRNKGQHAVTHLAAEVISEDGRSTRSYSTHTIPYSHQGWPRNVSNKLQTLYKQHKCAVVILDP